MFPFSVSIVFVNVRQTFMAGKPGMSSNKINWRCVIFQPMVFRFVWASSPSLRSPRLRSSLARPLATRSLAINLELANRSCRKVVLPKLALVDGCRAVTLLFLFQLLFKVFISSKIFWFISTQNKQNVTQILTALSSVHYFGNFMRTVSVHQMNFFGFIATHTSPL